MDKDCISAVVDEVALEGLDGITIETFWLRLKECKNFPLTLDDKSKIFLWRCIVSIKDFRFYELEEERPTPVIYNKQDCVDPQTGYLVEYDLGPNSETYPIEIINDGNIQGSCTTYKTRKDVTDDVRDHRHQPKLSLQEVTERYGSKLVVVASQEQRNMALMGPEFDRTYVLPDKNYCILERIGRQRYDGELSGGTLSLDAFKLQAKTIFYYTKRLADLGLITKQTVPISKSVSTQSKRSLYHLKRFTKKFMSKYTVLKELVTNFLSTCPDKRCDLVKAREQLKIDQKSFKKLYQQENKLFHVYVVKYRELHPDATEEEYAHRSTLEEKQIRVIELNEAASDDEDNEEDAAEQQGQQQELPNYEYTYERSQFRQCLSALQMASTEGVTLQSVGRIMGLDFITARGVAKALEERKDLVSLVVKDRGKQKVKMYVYKKFHDQSKILSEFTTEIQKLKKNMKKKPEIPSVLDKGSIDAAESAATTEVSMDTTDVNQSQTSILNETMDHDGNEEESSDEASDIVKLPSIVRKRKRADYRDKIYTDRHMKRMNWILEIVKENKIIDSEFALAKMIIQKEKEDGNTHIMHKKSLIRLLDILVQKKKLHIVKKEIQAGERKKTLTLLMDMSIQPDDPFVTSIITQAQLKFSSVQKEQLTEMNAMNRAKNSTSPYKTQRLLIPENIPDSAKESILRMQSLRSTLKHSDLIFDPKAYRDYGHRPKYQRAQTIHHVLFYLIYGYRGKIRADKSSRMNKIEESVFVRQDKAGGQSESENLSTDIWEQNEKLNPKNQCQAHEQNTENQVEHDGQGRTVQGGSEGHDSTNKTQSEGESSITQDQSEVQGQIEGQNHSQGQSKDQGQNEAQGSVQISQSSSQVQTQSHVEGSVTTNQQSSGQSGDQQQAPEPNVSGVVKGQSNKEDGTSQEAGSAWSMDKQTEEALRCKFLKLIENIPEPPVYLDEYTWRRYLPPLPQHLGFTGGGWALVSDILLQLPLCIFCSITMISYRIPGLKELLNDPIKSLYPVICLPKELIQHLLYARKYIFSFHENCINLCNMGLLFFGPQLMKEKDKVFIYLRKVTCLLDTRRSNQGCCMTSLPSRTERIYYSFNSEEDLETYWTDLRQFAFNSNLGFKNCDDPDIDDSDILVSLKESTKNKTVEEIDDNGHVPGNGRGAAGLDSSLFIHLYRSWNSISAQSMKVMKYPPRKKAKGVEKSSPVINTDIQEMKGRKELIRMPRIKLKERLTLLATSQDKAPEVVKIVSTDSKGNKGGRGIKRKNTLVHEMNKRRKLHNKSSKAEMKIRKKLRDEKDRQAFSKKVTQRVKWTPNQDTVLLICKIACLVMDRKRRGIPVPWATVRDFLHVHAPVESRDKTAAACQRRVTHSLKSQATKANLNIFLAEAMQDPVVIPFSQRQYLQQTDETTEIFEKLATYLMKKFKEGVVLTKPVLPEKLSDWDKFTVSTLNQNYKKSAPYQEARTVTHIMDAVLQNIFHSYVSCNDKYGRAYSMFKLLNQYPEVLLDNVLKRLKHDSLITRLKSEKTQTKSPAEAGLRVKLSQVYVYRLHSRFPRTIFDVTRRTMKDLKEACEDEEKGFFFHVTDYTEAGICASMIPLLYRQKLQCKIFMPTDIVRIDPSEKKPGRGKISAPKNLMQMAEEDSDEEDAERIQMDTAGGEDSMASETSQGCTSQEGNTSELSGGQSSLWQRENASIDGNKDAKDSKLAYHINPAVSIYLPEQEEEGTIGANCSHRESSRALITMRRSKAESVVKSFIFSMVDNFVISPAEISVSIGSKEMLTDANDKETTMEADNQQCPKAHHEEDRFGETDDHEDAVHASKDEVFRKCFVNRRIVREIIQRQTRILPAQVAMKDVLEKTEFSKRLSVLKTYKIIENSKDLGIKETKLKNQHENVEECKRNVQILQSHDIILKVGVASVRYVALCHCRPWIAHSFRNTKGRGSKSNIEDGFEDSALTTQTFVVSQIGIYGAYINEPSAVLSSAGKDSSADDKPKSHSVETESSVMEHFPIDNKQGPLSEVVGEPGSSKSPKRLSVEDPLEQSASSTCEHADMHSNSEKEETSYTADLQEQEVENIDGNNSTEVPSQKSNEYTSTSDKTDSTTKSPQSGNRMGTRSKSSHKRQSLDSLHVSTSVKSTSTYEKIRIQIFPWRKPEGTLNRPVFRMVLEAIHLHIMSNPGITCKNICAKYNPFFQPFCLIVLLEILEDIGCIQRTIIRERKTTTLFSPPVPPSTVTDADDGDVTCYEATIDSVSRLGYFLAEVDACDLPSRR